MNSCNKLINRQLKWLTIQSLTRRCSGETSKSKLPGHITTPSDRFWLKITQTLPESQIGQEVSLDTMEKAINRRRVGTNVIVCILGAIGFYNVAQYAKKGRDERVRNAPDPYAPR